MKTKAAILWKTHTKWSVEEIDLDPPNAGELLVKLAASGLCHSDEHLVTGDVLLDPALSEAYGLSQLPIISGHEGAGEVVEVGPNVANLSPGDHVVLSFIPSCGRRPSCAIGQQTPLRPGCVYPGWKADHRFHSSAPCGRRHRSGIMCCTGTFEPFTVVGESSCVKIEPHVPLDKAALVGCGVTTG